MGADTCLALLAGPVAASITATLTKIHVQLRRAVHQHQPPSQPYYSSCSYFITTCLWVVLQVRSQFRKIFTNMGFQEMPTNNYVESSFWNFDSLFQPQQHPARDAHDTFFLTSPATSDTFPEDYLKRVKVCESRTRSRSGHVQ